MTTINSRRRFLGATAAAAALGSTPLGFASQKEKRRRDLALVNGRIHTLDKVDTVVDSVYIRDGRFTKVGGVRHIGDDAEVINLRGRTVVPGLIDNHCHFIRIGIAVGHDMRALESAFSIGEVQKVIAAKAAAVPKGEFLTALRGLALRQWASPARHPTLDELTDAAPHHPVVISQNTNGQTNRLGRDRLRELGVAVSDTGAVNDDQAYIALRQFLTLETRKRELLSAAAYALSVGMTGFIDEHGNLPPANTAGFLDRTTGHDHAIALWLEGRLPVRLRPRFGVNNADFGGTDDPALLPVYVNNRWELLGDSMFRQAGIGEWAPRGEHYQNSLRIMAARPIQYQQHLISTFEIQAHLDALERFEQENPQFSVRKLYWSGGHLTGITDLLVERANKLGFGLVPQAIPYLTSNGGGPNFRMIVDLATVPVGSGSDGARVNALNAWSNIYYMTTGRNSGGALTNEGGRITRTEALRLYAGPEQGWFCKEEHLFGGIGVGRYGDLAVLAADVFDPKVVPDEQLRKMTSVLTIVDGRVMHDTGALDERRGHDDDDDDD